MARPKLEERPTKVNLSNRPKRVPINGYRNILNVAGQEEGFHYAWINQDNVPRFESAGYEFVTHDVEVGDRKINAASQIGGKVSFAAGNGVTAYLMRIPQEYYNEDQAALQAEVDELETSMYRKLNSDADGQYGQVKQRRGGDPI